MRFHTFLIKRPFIWIISFLYFLHATAWADQYLTDTPRPLNPGQGAADIYTNLMKIKKDSTLQIPSLEAGLGVMNNVHLRFSMPINLVSPQRGKTTYAHGDVGLGVKYRFIHETEIIPQVAFYPKFTLPTGETNKGGNGRMLTRLPLWLQKNWGPWKLSGGGGYAINAAPKKFNYAFGGILLRRDMNDKLTLGVEMFAQGPTSRTNPSTLILNLGATYYLTPRVFLLAGAGHSVAGMQYLKGFLGLGMSWGPQTPGQHQPSI